jgi:hypothetical protein
MTDQTIIDRLRQANPNFWYAELCHEAADALSAAHAARDAAERERDEARANCKNWWKLRAELATKQNDDLRAQLTTALRERDEARAALEGK